MFDKEYTFKGRHAEIVKKLTNKFDEKNSLFLRNLDVYLLAPIVGFLYNKKSELDTNEPHTKIFVEQLVSVYDNLLFNYRMIVLLDKNNEKDFEKRIDNAFRKYNSEENEIELFESYVRGGLEVLEEKLLSTHTVDDYINNLYDFLEDIDDRYNNQISSFEDIYQFISE